MKPKVDYFDLIVALEQHYYVSMLYGWPPMCNVYDSDDEDERNLLASIESREGAFKTWVTKVYVYNKAIDEFFQRVIGLNYYRIRVDEIKEDQDEEDADYDDDDLFEDEEPVD